MASPIKKVCLRFLVTLKLKSMAGAMKWLNFQQGTIKEYILYRVWLLARALISGNARK